MTRALVLVGHGGVPRNMPRQWVREMKQFSRRAQDGDAGAAEAARTIDERIRTFPRSDETDPYGAGIRRLAERVQARLDGWQVVVAFNEFCAPTIEDAIGQIVDGGTLEVRVMTTMITPGGTHSESDIPQALVRARAAHPAASIEFVWPLDLDHVANMFVSCLTNVVE
jgi:sirohydrochlorin cobaltochelatase